MKMQYNDYPPRLKYIKQWMELKRVEIFLELTIKAAIKGPLAPEGPRPNQEWQLDDELGSPIELERTAAEMMLCRSIDNFLCYLEELLVAVYQAKPETLRSNEKVTTEFVLSFGTMNELIEGLALRKVEELAYTGTRDLFSYFDKIGIALFDSDEEMEKATELIEYRNVIVHNRGIASKTFKKRMPAHPAQIGEPLPLPLEFLKESIQFFKPIVDRTDERAVEKFPLWWPFIPYPPPVE